jgi:hypothetical protein
MRTKITVSLAIIAITFIAAARPAPAAVYFRSGQGQSDPGGSWEGGYYDAAWGMPLAVIVPPTARWQTDYAWGAGGTRLSRINARFHYEYPGPESGYRQGNYLPAPPQPSDTRQMGDYYVRGPRR